jgi:predicted transcriptional regulator
MEKLTKAEEPIMQQIWRNKKVFVKDILKELPEPKPAYNTVLSIVRILESKGMVAHEAYGRIHQYYPLVSKSEYRLTIFKSLIKDYFDGSYTSLVSQMVEQDEDLNQDEINEIKNLLNRKDNS